MNWLSFPRGFFNHLKTISAIFIVAINSNCTPPDPALRDQFGLAGYEKNGAISKPIITTSLSDTIFPVIFEAAFSKGTTVRQGESNFAFSIYEPGKIKIESGKIIACDPIVMHDAICFTEHFPIGDFPVQLAMTNSTNGYVAFSRILFSEKPVVKWEYALKPGQRHLELKDSTFYCYGVDAGTGIFIDSIANESFGLQGELSLTTIFVTNANQHNYSGYIHEFQGHNLATFSTGGGDGCYATYIGLDEDGKVCRLLTDFGMVAWWEL